MALGGVVAVAPDRPWSEGAASKIAVPPIRVPVSSLRIVPVPWPFATVAPETFATFTVKVSVGSTTVSPVMATAKVARVSPAAMVWRVRLRAV